MISDLGSGRLIDENKVVARRILGGRRTLRNKPSLSRKHELAIEKQKWDNSTYIGCYGGDTM